MIRIVLNSMVIGMVGGYFGGLFVLYPPNWVGTAGDWLRRNPPHDYVVTTRWLRAVRYSHHRRRQVDAEHVEWARSLVVSR